MQSLATLIEGWADHAERTAIVCDGATLDYAQLHARIGHWRKQLQVTGIAPGACIALRGKVSGDMIGLLFALVENANVVVPFLSASDFEVEEALETACVDGVFEFLNDGAGQDLDFVLSFSSVASFHRDAGQSNYCAGCTFKDSFAQAMRARHPYPVKIVNWAYWGSVGVVTDAFYRKRMESRGIGSIESDEAMRELEAFLASDMDQLALIKVISQRALDDLWVSEEVRYYQDHYASSGYGEAVIAS